MDNHPVLLEMQKVGCGNFAQIDLAFQVYIELCEGLRLWDVGHRYCPELDLIILTARRQRELDHEVFLPMAASSEINLDWLQTLYDTLQSNSKLTLAIVDTDSTVVLQEVSRGLIPPVSDKRIRRKLDPATLLAPELIQHATATAAFQVSSSLEL